MTDLTIGAKVSAHPDIDAWRHTNSAGPILGIIIPYRAREEHLSKLLPHLISFFKRDLGNSHIKPLIIVSEQADNGKFNRGWCKNGGFLAVERYCDYLCFHDVDYLPIWADYSYSAFPTRIIWWGMHLRPLRANMDNKFWLRASKDTFGAVVVMDKDQFVKANGYSNGYSGWGYEDDDLKARLECLGFLMQTRDGTFTGLEHDHEGFDSNVKKNQDNLDNEALFSRLRQQYQGLSGFHEGLSTMPLGQADVAFERWHGLDESESLIVCRLRIQRAETEPRDR